MATEGEKWWLVGLTDGEGSFFITIQKHPSSNLGWYPDSHFQIALNSGDTMILEKVKKILGTGDIYCKPARGHTKQATVFRSTDRASRKIVRDFFSKYPLKSKKAGDFKIWCKVLDLMNEGKHKTIEGLLEICRLRDQMNLNKKRQQYSYSFLKTQMETTFKEKSFC